ISAPCATGRVRPYPSPRQRPPTCNTLTDRTAGALPAHSVVFGFPTGAHWLTTLEPPAVRRSKRGLLLTPQVPGNLAIDYPVKPDPLLPHLIAAYLTDGTIDTRYICPNCGLDYVRRKALLGHLGMIANIPASCSKLKTRSV